MHKHTLIVAMFAGFGLTVPVNADVYTFRTIAKTGDPAPGTINGEFSEMGFPFINFAGQVTFTARTNSFPSSSGMWWTPVPPSSDPNSMALIAGSGWLIPGGAQVYFATFDFSLHHPMLTDKGDVGFAAPLGGNIPENKVGLFRLIDGVLSTVAIPGDAAPGLQNVTLDTITNLPTMSENNLMAFKAKLAGQGVNAGNDQALYMHWFGGLNMVKREGLQAPGVPGATFGETLPFWVQINDNGRVAFHSYLNTANGPIMSHWTGWPGQMTLIAKAGDQSPIGNNPFADFDPIVDAGVLSQNGFSFFNPIEIGGQNYNGLWYYNFDTSNDMSIAYVGGGLPGGIYTQVTNESWCAAGDGTTSFRASFNGPDLANSAVFRRHSPQTVETIALEGDAPYGYWANVEFDDLAGTFSGVSTIIDDTGRMYFEARVRGAGVNQTNDRGFWSVDNDGEWNFVIREGQWITLDDNISRQVESFMVHTSVGLHSGRRPGVNNRGDIAMRIIFTDGVSAIVVAERPTCLGDIVEDGVVDVSDLLALISSWGNCPTSCLADITPQPHGNGSVNVSDLLTVISAWGPCP